ncbi:hypothetical protein CGRA01v4_02473 [Colletotrichum graminicola]|nr:hypothetical protein CGRA01v4_02473 [Colletotrichum graminicola]
MPTVRSTSMPHLTVPSQPPNSTRITSPSTCRLTYGRRRTYFRGLSLASRACAASSSTPRSSLPGHATDTQNPRYRHIPRVTWSTLSARPTRRRRACYTIIRRPKKRSLKSVPPTMTGNIISPSGLLEIQLTRAGGKVQRSCRSRMSHWFDVGHVHRRERDASCGTRNHKRQVCKPATACRASNVTRPGCWAIHPLENGRDSSSQDPAGLHCIPDGGGSRAHHGRQVQGGSAFREGRQSVSERRPSCAQHVSSFHSAEPRRGGRH